MSYRLIIGNKNYSSWSLRAWLCLRLGRVDFAETRIPMFEAGWKEVLARYTPAGRVPVLIDGDFAVWDSLSIFEYVRERHEGAIGWPDDPRHRAHARSITAEMHAGFPAVREELPQNLRRQHTLRRSQLSPAAQAEIERLESMWAECLEQHHHRGPWLFGKLSLADVMYAPVALRFVTYRIGLTAAAEPFVELVSALPEVAEWIRDAKAESETIPAVDTMWR